MGLWDIDQEPEKLVESKVQEELYRLENHADFTVASKEDDGIKFNFDGGSIEFGLPAAYEYASTKLTENLVIMRLLYVDKQLRGKGIGTATLLKVLETFKDSKAAIVIYPIPIEFKAWAAMPQMVEDLELQKRLILFYERAGFSCLKYERLYDIRYLMELITRYSFKRLMPTAMSIYFKNTPTEVTDEIAACTISSEEMFKDVTEKQTVPELTAVHLLSDRYVV